MTTAAPSPASTPGERATGEYEHEARGPGRRSRSGEARRAEAVEHAFRLRAGDGCLAARSGEDAAEQAAEQAAGVGRGGQLRARGQQRAGELAELVGPGRVA